VSQRGYPGQQATGRGRVRELEGQLNAAAGGLPAPGAGGRRWRLRASVEPIVGRDGALYLARAGDDDLIVPRPAAIDAELLARLAAGEPTAAELAEALELPLPVVADKLAALDAAGVLVAAPTAPPLEPADAARYGRQLPWLAELGDERALQRRLGRARVAVIGCGGLGCWALAGLLAAGVRHLRLVDDDVVELSNLNRQILYGPGDLGAPKVRAAASWLRAYDPAAQIEPRRVRVDSAAAAVTAVAGMDAVLLVADTPPYELARWVNTACVAARIPFMTAGQHPPLLRIGPLYRPGSTACFTCHERAARRASADYDGYVAHAGAHPARGATLGPASGIIGTTLASELVHLLLGADPATAGTALLFDLRTLGVRREPIARDPRCPECQHVG
jgi:bacteriocin biosynthesis cyclodehydratase domain-containing protein